MHDTGLVELSASVTLLKVNKLIEAKQAYWDRTDELCIEWQINESAKDRWWGLVKGKVVTREEAIKILDKDSDMFGWRCYSGGSYMNEWKTIHRMCEAVLATNTAQPHVAKVYLSGKQINYMKW